jgi:hypothetical protein
MGPGTPGLQYIYIYIYQGLPDRPARVASSDCFAEIAMGPTTVVSRVSRAARRDLFACYVAPRACTPQRHGSCCIPIGIGRFLGRPCLPPLPRIATETQGPTKGVTLSLFYHMFGVVSLQANIWVYPPNSTPSNWLVMVFDIPKISITCGTPLERESVRTQLQTKIQTGPRDAPPLTPRSQLAPTIIPTRGTQRLHAGSVAILAQSPVLWLQSSRARGNGDVHRGGPAPARNRKR